MKQYKQTNEVKTYMSITSFIRTLTATSIDGFPLRLLNLDDTVIRLGVGEGASEHTAAMTSHTSSEFSFNGCCSLKYTYTKIKSIYKDSCSIDL